LINKVVPAWSEADLNGSQLNTTVDGRVARDTTRAWVASWRDEDHVTNDFVQASADRFSEIWGGAIQMSATVSDARVVRADMLENFGGESFWQVEVERTVTAPGIKQTEQITWYFMLSHDSGGPLLHEFFLPSDMSTDPSRHDHDHG
jgi:hypothetical protein